VLVRGDSREEGLRRNRGSLNAKVVSALLTMPGGWVYDVVLAMRLTDAALVAGLTDARHRLALPRLRLASKRTQRICHHGSHCL
jgi:hypothetical protein